MGWTSTHRLYGESVHDFMLRHGLERNIPDRVLSRRVLDSALVNLSEYYAAIEDTDKATGNKTVWAFIAIVRMGRGGHYNFSYKDMTEDDGPFATNCPKRILDLLTSTTSASAAAWRENCQAKIDQRAQFKLKPGDKLESISGIKMTDGTTVHDLVVAEIRGPRVVCCMGNTGGRCRLARQFILERIMDGDLLHNPAPKNQPKP